MSTEKGVCGDFTRRDEYVTDCADIDDIIVFTKDGKMTVTKLSPNFYRKNIIHVAVFKKKDYAPFTKIYRDTTYMKRFPVTGVTLGQSVRSNQWKSPVQGVLFSANPNGKLRLLQSYCVSREYKKTKMGS